MKDFIVYVSTAHSWYKCTYPRPFYIYLNASARLLPTSDQDGTVGFKKFLESDAHYNWRSTDFWRENFGYWEWSDQKIGGSKHIEGGKHCSYYPPNRMVDLFFYLPVIGRDWFGRRFTHAKSYPLKIAFLKKLIMFVEFVYGSCFARNVRAEWLEQWWNVNRKEMPTGPDPP